jgi:hypothetical protein
MEPDHIRYETATDNGRDFVYTQISHTPVPQRDHILQAAKEQLASNPWIPDAAPWELEDCIRAVATRHLKRQTGIHGYIAGAHGETLRVVTVVPEPLTERLSFDPGPYLRASEMRPLTHAQLGLLPELTVRLREIIPEHQQPHVEDLVRKVVQDIPARADLLRAYQRTSVTEVLAEHYARTTPPPGIEDLPASIKIARLNFPEHPHPAAERPANQHSSHALETLRRPEPDQGISR